METGEADRRASGEGGLDCPACQARVTSGESRCPSCGASLVSLATTVGGGPPSLQQLDFPPGAVFANRYTIIERAGRGGMGVVYKAIDTALDSVVALKLIRPELALRASFVAGFRREVRLTRRITHPNVCRVHDLGESHGILYLSMEWIQGETLRQLLNHAGPLDPERAFEIAERMLLALEAAHAKGIIHRDLKPENVMIDDAGSVFVMDFGLALQQGPGEEAIAGVAAGTPAYMAPEQRRGGAVDARTDLFALGLVFAELLSGRMPDPEDRQAQALPPGVRRQVGPLLDRFLCVDLDGRFASARDAIEALGHLRSRVSGARSVPRKAALSKGLSRRAILWGGAAILSAALAAVFVLRSLTEPGPAKAPPSNRAEEGAHPSAMRSYVEMGMDNLRQDSDHLQGVDEAIRLFYRAREVDPLLPSAWAGLGAAYWIRHEQDSESSSKEEAEKAVTRAFELAPGLPEALCAEGIGFFAESNYAEAQSRLEAAVKARPDLDLAWARLGSVHGRMGDYAGAREALGTAIRLRPDSPVYRIMLGNVHQLFAQNDAAISAYRKAIELNPRSRMAWNNLGAAYLRIEKRELAAEAFKHSLDIEENDSTRSNLGTIYYQLGRYETAVALFRRGAELHPERSVLWGNLGDALQKAGKRDEAHDAYLTAVRTAREEVVEHPRDAHAHEQLGLYCARVGDALCAIEEATRANQLTPRDTAIVFSNAIIRAILNRPDEALDWLERAVRLGLAKTEILNEQALDPLHGNPRYLKILALAS